MTKPELAAAEAMRSLKAADNQDREPEVLHAEPWPGLDTHPCGVLAVRGVTRTPRHSRWNYATGKWLPMQYVTCPGCIAKDKR